MLALNFNVFRITDADIIFEGSAVQDQDGNIGVVLEFTSDPFAILEESVATVAYVAFDNGRFDYFHEGEIVLAA